MMSTDNRRHSATGHDRNWTKARQRSRNTEKHSQAGSYVGPEIRREKKAFTKKYVWIRDLEMPDANRTSCHAGLLFYPSDSPALCSARRQRESAIRSASSRLLGSVSRTTTFLVRGSVRRAAGLTSRSEAEESRSVARDRPNRSKTEVQIGRSEKQEQVRPFACNATSRRLGGR